MISAAVFAELLNSLGADAQAMTGGQAGIVTDDTFGDARILRVDPQPCARRSSAASSRSSPAFRARPQRRGLDARARRQRPDRDRARRRARGGVGRHLHRRQRRDDGRSAPRRGRAHRRPRVTPAEMVELAGQRRQGDARAKRPNSRTRTGTPYAVKGLRSNVGTTIDDEAPIDRDRPVTGITALRNVAFFRVIQGLERRRRRAPTLDSRAVRPAGRARHLDRHDQRQRCGRVLRLRRRERRARSARAARPQPRVARAHALREALDRRRRDARHAGRHVPRSCAR